MSDYEIYPLTQSSLLYLYSRRDGIQINPDYQRMGDVWPLSKRQLLIDSFINEFDIPKLYFHRLRRSKSNPNYDYAIIDGRQRLETIWHFIDGDFPLSGDFVYQKDPKIKAGELTYKEFSEKYPKLATQFDSTTLSIMVVDTDDLDFIEEMFSRLNEAVPLNAAEKRNAFGGPLPKIIREIANEDFFKKRVPISNKRYQHRDISAKLLYLEHENKVVDLKKVYLDEFVKNNVAKKRKYFSVPVQRVKEVLSIMHSTFIDRDPLLKSPGMLVLYYLLFKAAMNEKWDKQPNRKLLIEFEEVRRQNRRRAEEDIASAYYALLEFDTMMQTPNDAYAIRERLKVLIEFCREGTANT